MRDVIAMSIVTIVAVCAAGRADCPLDHLIIGCNFDGVPGTDDDNRLFIDCRQKYRDSGGAEYARWCYPLRESIFPSYRYRIGEPGFDVFQHTHPSAAHTYDPNRAPAGDPELDYSLTVECLALSGGLRAVHKEYPQFTITAVGQDFSHSYIHNLRGNSHIHMSYQAADGESLQWITLRVWDTLADGARYEPSEPVTIVFNTEPLAGDLLVDGRVDLADLAELSHYWLAPESSRRNDFCERADTDRDGAVDLRDFACMAINWRTIQQWGGVITEEAPVLSSRGEFSQEISTVHSPISDKTP